jgi:hypothetical protein
MRTRATSSIILICFFLRRPSRSSVSTAKDRPFQARLRASVVITFVLA